MHRSIITGSGCYIPEKVVKNSDFLASVFYSDDGSPIGRPAADIVDKFRRITGIVERRYAPSGVLASDMATRAAELAIADSGIDPENIDQIILAHNFGDICGDRSSHTDIVPSLASRVKMKLGILNPSCIPFDLIFGCPGWLQGLIHADAFFKAGVAKNALVIGTETLSRVIDRNDRDGMIFSDGAGACILQYKGVEGPGRGILSARVRSDCGEEIGYIHLNGALKPAVSKAAISRDTSTLGRDASTMGRDTSYIRMKGRKVYEYALRHVPAAMKDCLDASGFGIGDLKAIFIHQANEKMDEAIVRGFYGLYGVTEVPANIMPMCIQWLGNNSVATIPTLFDLVKRGRMDGYRIDKGDILLFASVGAGMNINAVCYGCD